MQKPFNILILLSFLSVLTVPVTAKAEIKAFLGGWSMNHSHYRESQNYHPYVEDLRHTQIPQWEHKDWYAEDWLAQKDGMELVRGFYAADILRDQKTGYADLPELVVGPNFYRLSGYDKRRVTHIVDIVYGITESKSNGSFMLRDWYTKRAVGVFDQNGLRLH